MNLEEDIERQRMKMIQIKEQLENQTILKDKKRKLSSQKDNATFNIKQLVSVKRGKQVDDQ